MIKPSKVVTSGCHLKKISFVSQMKTKLHWMFPHAKLKHLSSLSPECPIRVNVIAHIIMCVQICVLVGGKIS